MFIMEFVLVLFLFALGVVLIVKGGDFFVDAASWMAEVSGIPKLIVGATIVSVATTLPELLVSILAAVEGKVDMSIGNAVGSVTANLGLIMAIALLFMPGKVKRSDIFLKSALMLCASGMIVLSGKAGQIGLFHAALLMVIFFLFIIENLHSAKQSLQESKDERPEFTRNDLKINLLKFIFGAAGIVLGARLLVDNGSELARLAGVSERIIGVTLVAVGTSLPELVTTITAIVKKQSALSVGNILGANILDLTMIMPLCALISGKPLPIAAASAMLDLPACLLVGAVAVIPTLITSKFQRWQGVLLLIIYIVYLYLTCTAI